MGCGWCVFFFQAEDGIRDRLVTGVQTCALPISLGEVVDLRALSAISKKHNVILAVDNCLMTPALQKPLALGSDIVIHSATKYIDGQGRCLAGAIAGSSELLEEISSFIRTTGPTLSAFNAWIVLKGLETLPLRMRAHCDNARQLANWLNDQPFVEKLHYLGLESHPHHQIAKEQQCDFGGIVSFEVSEIGRAHV